MCILHRIKKRRQEKKIALFITPLGLHGRVANNPHNHNDDVLVLKSI